jgi:hypothetical protein
MVEYNERNKELIQEIAENMGIRTKSIIGVANSIGSLTIQVIEFELETNILFLLINKF